MASVGAAVLSSLAGRALAQSAPLKMNVQLNWIETADFASLFAAEKQGYDKEAGIQQVFLPGGPQVDAIQAVAGGSAPVGLIGTIGQVALARAAGIPVKAIGSLCAKSPTGLISLAKNPIRKPQDAIGKKIGVQAGARQAWAEILAANNIREDQMTIVPVGIDVTPLVSGQVEGYWGTAVNQHLALKARGIDNIIMTRNDAGSPEYFDVIFALDKTIAEQSDLLTRWLRAVIRGAQYYRDNSDAVAAYIVSRSPSLKLNIEEQKAQAAAELEFVRPPNAEGRLLDIDPATAQKALDQLNGVGQLTKKTDVKEIFTPALLDAAYGGKKSL